MPVAWECRRCKKREAQEWEAPCKHCGSFFRAVKTFVGDGEVDGAELATIDDDKAIPAGDLMRSIGDVSSLKVDTGMPGINHVFGGGLPRSGAVLFCGESGAGKSTLITELFRTMAKRRRASVYITAEQDLLSFAQQMSWLGPLPSKYMLIRHAKDQDEIIDTIEEHRAYLYALDSLHAVENVTDEKGYDLATGHWPALVRLASQLNELAAKRRAVIFAVGHVNNDGTLAGGSSARHMLNATLVLRKWPGLTGFAREKDPRRILQFEGKTRFGPLGRRALFSMQEEGFFDKGPLLDDGAGNA